MGDMEAKTCEGMEQKHWEKASVSLALKGLLVLSSFVVNVGGCPKGDGSRESFYQEGGERQGR